MDCFYNDTATPEIYTLSRTTLFRSDILTQLSAVKSALDGVGVQILTSHAKGCVRTAIAENGGEEALEELMGVIRKMVK